MIDPCDYLVCINTVSDILINQQSLRLVLHRFPCYANDTERKSSVCHKSALDFQSVILVCCGDGTHMARDGQH